MAQLTNILGVVHGRTIELEQELDVPDGEAVSIVITRVSASRPSKEALEAAAGSLSGLDDEIDEFNRWYRDARHSDPASRDSLE